MWYRRRERGWKGVQTFLTYNKHTRTDKPLHLIANVILNDTIQHQNKVTVSMLSQDIRNGQLTLQ